MRCVLSSLVAKMTPSEALESAFDGRLQRVTAEAMARREVSEKWGKDVAKEATK